MPEPSDPSPPDGPAETATAPFADEPAGRTAVEPWPVVPGYDVVGELGRGGMGDVYRARDRALGRDVAVKVLQRRYPVGSAAAHRFVQEARITGQLQHPGIPPVHAVGALADGRPFLAMKLIKGRTLDEMLQDHPAGALDRFAAVFEQVCQAVAYAHGHGVLHRDLKPQNVMVGAFGEVQVMDWGLAKFRAEARTASAETSAASTFFDPRGEASDDSRTRAGSFLGTPAYMPPEQAAGAVEQVTERSDVFGLGAILCTILTGKPPFVGDSAETARVLAAQGRVEAAFARLDGCGADPEWVALCKRCLAAAPADRPADAGAVAEAAAGLRAAADARARRAELDRVRAAGDRAAAELKAVEAAKRRRAQAALALAVVALVAVAGAFAWWRDRQAADRRAEAAAAAARADQAVASAADLAANLRDTYRFDAAGLALDQAERLLPRDAPPAVRARLAAARDDLAFVRRLDAARVSRVRSDFLRGIGEADAAYAAAFRDRGLDVTGADPDAVAARVRADPIKRHLVAALDDWTWFAVDPAARPRLAAVAARAAPGAWSDLVRDAIVRGDRPELERLSADPAAEAAPTDLVIALFQAAGHAWPAGEALLGRIAHRHPDNFWVQFEAGFFYHAKRPRPDAALAHFQAARALRPDLPLVADMVGEALLTVGRPDAAVAAYRESTRLDPRHARGYRGIGAALRATGDRAGAVAAVTAAAELDPSAVTLAFLGDVFVDDGNVPRAAQAYERAVRVAPDDAHVHNMLAWVLATGPDGQRDGPRAVALAERACELTRWTNPFCIETLAAARAEVGAFDAAVELQTRSMAVPGFTARRAGECERRLACFRRREAYRDPLLGGPRREVAPPPRPRHSDGPPAP